MKYLHTTIKNSEQILKCIALESDSDTKSSALVILQNYAKLVEFEKIDGILRINQQEIYPFGVGIRHVIPIGLHLAVITTSSQLMMLESKPPFRRVSPPYQLSTGLMPSTVPIAHCAASQAGENFLATGFCGQAVVATFDSEDNPSLKTITLPEKIVVHSVAATQNPEEFLILITALASGKKFILKINVNDETASEPREVDRSARELITVFDQDGYGKQFLFCDRKVIANILEPEPITFETEAPVGAYFSTQIGELVFQLENQKIFVYDSKTQNLTDRSTLEPISLFCPLPNDLLLCVEEHGSAYVVQVAHSLGLSSSQFGFNIYPSTPIPCMPTIAGAQFVDSNIVLSCGKGKDASIVTLSNTIKHEIEELPMSRDAYTRGKGSEIALESTYPNSVLTLYTVKEGVLLTSKTQSMRIFGYSPIDLSPTITTGTMGDNSVQVYNHGVKILETEQSWFSDLVIHSAAITDDMIVVCDSNDTVTLLDANLTPIKSATIPSVHGFAFCEDVIAVATDSDKGTSLVTMYSRDLEPKDDVIQLMFSVCSMVFQQETGSLFIATTDGTVRKYSFDGPNFSQSTQKIFVGTKPATIIPFQNSAIIVSDKVFFFIEDELNLLKIDSQCLAIGHFVDDPNALAMFTKDEKLLKITILDSGADIMTKSTKVDFMPRHVVANQKFSYTLCKSGKQKNARSQIVALDFTNNNVFVLDFDIGIEVTTICTVDSSSLCVCSVNFAAVPLYTRVAVYDTTGDVFTEKSHIDNWKVPNFSAAVQHNDGIMLAAKHGILRVHKDTLEDMKFGYPAINTSAMVSVGKYLWIASSSHYVQVLTLVDQKPNNLTVIDTLPRQVTSMVPIDKTSVAVADKFGNITILRLPEDFVVDSPWCFVKDPENGAIYGKLERVASFCTGGMITSVLVSPKSNSIYYTTLLGQIGALIPISNDEDFSTLQSVETQTEKACSGEFGLMLPKAIDAARMAVLNGDMISMLRLLDTSVQERIENGLKVRKEWVMGIICRLKASAKF